MFHPGRQALSNMGVARGAVASVIDADEVGVVAQFAGARAAELQEGVGEEALGGLAEREDEADRQGVSGGLGWRGCGGGAGRMLASPEGPAWWRGVAGETGSLASAGAGGATPGGQARSGGGRRGSCGDSSVIRDESGCPARDGRGHEIAVIEVQSRAWRGATGVTRGERSLARGGVDLDGVEDTKGASRDEVALGRQREHAAVRPERVHAGRERAPSRGETRGCAIELGEDRGREESSVASHSSEQGAWREIGASAPSSHTVNGDAGGCGSGGRRGSRNIVTSSRFRARAKVRTQHAG